MIRKESLAKDTVVKKYTRETDGVHRLKYKSMKEIDCFFIPDAHIATSLDA